MSWISFISNPSIGVESTQEWLKDVVLAHFPDYVRYGDRSFLSTVILSLLYFFRSGKTDQIFLTTQGFLTSAYHYVQCPVPVLKWLFRVREMFERYCFQLYFPVKSKLLKYNLIWTLLEKKLIQLIKPMISVD